MSIKKPKVFTMTSILIATYDRPFALKKCLQSIQRNTLTHFEVILVDQSTDTETKRVIQQFHDKRFIYKHLTTKNKSIALNYALNFARGTICCFTDDDCIVSPNWLSRITQDFSSHPDIEGVCGTIKPYRPVEHTNAHCVSCFQQKYLHRVSEPKQHSLYIGYGNNMAWRNHRKDMQLFASWLGPNSVAAAAEDAEFIIKHLLAGKTILCDPSVMVYHDNWMNREKLQNQNILYIRGEMACYGYFAFFGLHVAKLIIAKNFIDSLKDEKRLCGNFIKRKTMTFHDWKYAFLLFINKLYGFIIGAFYYLQEGHKTYSLNRP